MQASRSSPTGRVLPGVINSFSFAIPGTPPFPAGPTFARFRCSSQAGLGPAGGAPDGEVEDYQVRIEEPLDWGDAPDPAYPTLAANNGASHILTANGPVLGALVDAEPDGQPNGTATGDDNSGLADEDGVAFATPLLPGQQACVNVTQGGRGRRVIRLDRLRPQRRLGRQHRRADPGGRAGRPA